MRAPRWSKLSGAIALVGACIWLAVALTLGVRALRPSWEVSAPATRLDSLPAELFFLDAPELARRGPARLVVLRFDGEVDVVPHHFRAHGLSAAQSIDRWSETLAAPLLINAGQFNDVGEHLGWLRSRGTWLRAQRHPSWLGLLVSGPTAAARSSAEDSERTTRIVDLARDEPAVAERYDNVVQSMMLLDAAGKPRVRKSDQAACRTVIGEDRQGRLVIVLTEGAVTLSELAGYLASAPLYLVRALNLDGGIESQLALKSSEVELQLFGQYGAERTALGPHQPLGRAPLPAVLAISPASRREGP